MALFRALVLAFTFSAAEGLQVTAFASNAAKDGEVVKNLNDTRLHAGRGSVQRPRTRAAHKSALAWSICNKLKRLFFGKKEEEDKKEEDEKDSGNSPDIEELKPMVPKPEEEPKTEEPKTEEPKTEATPSTEVEPEVAVEVPNGKPTEEEAVKENNEVVNVEATKEKKPLRSGTTDDLDSKPPSNTKKAWGVCDPASASTCLTITVEEGAMLGLSIKTSKRQCMVKVDEVNTATGGFVEKWNTEHPKQEAIKASDQFHIRIIKVNDFKITNDEGECQEPEVYGELKKKGTKKVITFRRTGVTLE